MKKIQWGKIHLELHYKDLFSQQVIEFLSFQYGLNNPWECLYLHKQILNVQQKFFTYAVYEYWPETTE